ncbi:MAG: PDZ domain-containing protein [Pirellula sp.]|nr:PDZ domain-containing protein [Pirellula sp.]
MRILVRVLAIGSFLGFFSLTAPGDEKQRRDEAVRGDKSRFSASERWMYNDLETGFTLARELGKPVLVVLRCVPCKACTGLDETILQDKKLQSLLDQFVCVRLINANDLRLKQFQFDYDLSFSTMFFHGDGTIYGRFGSWLHQVDEMNTTTTGFRVALERVLEIHRGYPGNASALQSKQGRPTPFDEPTMIPGLAGKYQRQLNWEGNVVQSCIHCHQIGDAYRAWYRGKGESIPSEWLYPMPDPVTIGLILESSAPWKVKEATAGSVAANCGLQKGDELVSVDGAPIVSIADISWALQGAKDPGRVTIQWQRGDEGFEAALELPKGWRSNSDISNRVGTWQMRAMALGGMVLKGIDEPRRVALKLEKNALGLRVDHVGEYGEHAAAKKAGFRVGDILLAIEGIEGPLSESQLIGYVLTQHLKPTRLKTMVQRGEERIELELPVQ